MRKRVIILEGRKKKGFRCLMGFHVWSLYSLSLNVYVRVCRNCALLERTSWVPAPRIPGSQLEGSE